MNKNRCKPPLDDEEVSQIVGSAAKYSRGEMRIDESTSDEVGVLMSDVKSEKVQWLWKGRIPLGKLTLLEGDPDFGKSIITMDIASWVTTGALYDGGALGVHGGVVILNAEDGMSDTIKPRLVAAGADTTRVLGLSPIKNDGDILSIPGDIPLFERAIEKVAARLLIVDPLSVFMQGDPNKDSEVRKALTPLSHMAERTGIAVLVVRHFTKNVETKALYRGGGSIGIIGAARSAMAVAEHPDDEELRVLVPQKANLTKKEPALAYTIVEEDNGAPRIEWKGTVDLTAREAINPDPATTNKVDEAVEWLKTRLAACPFPAESVKSAACDAGIKPRTLDRAKSKAGIVQEWQQHEGTRVSYWTLPDERHERQERHEVLADGVGAESFLAGVA